MRLDKILIGALAGLALAGSATAQVNTVNQIGLTTEYIRKTTYSAAFFGLVPAASATDILCIAASPTKTVRLQSIRLTGTAGTLVTTPVVLLARASVDTAGTVGTTTANPANTIAKRLTTDPTATAVLVSYTANPTINDSSPTYIDTANVTLPVSGTSVMNPGNGNLFDYSLYVEDLQREPTLPVNSTRQFCVNLNAVSVSSGVLAGTVTWTEE